MQERASDSETDSPIVRMALPLSTTVLITVIEHVAGLHFSWLSYTKNQLKKKKKSEKMITAHVNES